MLIFLLFEYKKVNKQHKKVDKIQFSGNNKIKLLLSQFEKA